PRGTDGVRLLVSGESDRPFCHAATEHGILLAPGDCFDVPSHFRPGLCRRWRQFLEGARPLRSIRKELVCEDGHSMTGTCCDAINSPCCHSDADRSGAGGICFSACGWKRRVLRVLGPPGLAGWYCPYSGIPSLL